MIAGVAGALPACDRDIPAVESMDQPLVEIVGATPQSGERDVPIDAEICVRFNRFLRPSSVARQAVLATAGGLDAVSGEPNSWSYQFEPIYDPYLRQARFTLRGDGRWVPKTLHTFRIRPPTDSSDTTGIRAVDGAPLDGATTISFQTSDKALGVDSHEPWPRVGYCRGIGGASPLPSARSVLEACALGGCHAGSNPQAGLDLSGVGAIRSTAMGVLARQVVPLSSAGAIAVNPLVFSNGMPRVDPGSPGNSYLVYKLLINPRNYPPVGTSVPVNDRGSANPFPLEAPSSKELERLRNLFVRLEPMPRGSSLRAEQVRALVAWIGGGGGLDDSCP